MVRHRRVFSISNELLRKSREAALSAVQTFNNPLIRFKSETFIVLMIIAWTYLLHSYYRRKGVEYRHYHRSEHSGQRRIFDRTRRGAYKYWELEHCLNDVNCPLDEDTINNLKFLIGLRHEIEHQMIMQLDEYLEGRYQACALNYNHYIKQLFGDKNGLDTYMVYSIQFADLSPDQLIQPRPEPVIPDRLKTFILEFDLNLSEVEFNSERYSYRLFFSKKLVNHVGQSDHVIEFIKADSPLAQDVPKEQWVLKEIEKSKYLAKQVCAKMWAENFIDFKIKDHTELWQTMDAKNHKKGYGIHLGGNWYWYDSWLQVVREHCAAHNDRYALLAEDIET